MSDISHDVSIAHENWNRIENLEPLVMQAIKTAFLVAGNLEQPVSLLLADNTALQQLNRDFRGKDMPTNVLSFPSPEAFHAESLGDIALAFETVQTEAQRDGKSFTSHLSHLVIHGVLHLLNHDHEKEEQAQIMESLEIAAMAHLGLDNPYDPIKPPDS
jgi:probable rRNA maturation factor